MNLYIGIRGNVRGNIYDLTEDGLEEITYRVNEDGHKIPAGYCGLVIPFESLREDIIRLGRKGQQVDEKIYEHFKH